MFDKSQEINLEERNRRKLRFPDSGRQRAEYLGKVWVCGLKKNIILFYMSYFFIRNNQYILFFPE